MNLYLFWILFGIILMLLELIIPGGIVVFLGLAASGVGAALYFGLLTNLMEALLAWFISSLVLVLILRAVFMKYFEGSQMIENVDEDLDMIGSIVLVSETVQPYKEGRVKFRDSSWVARSEEELPSGAKAVISGRDGNILIIKPI